jgi:MFS family permease
MPHPRRVILFVNVAHALDHFVLLVFPTAAILIAREFGLDYGAVIALATGCFVAFGLFALPVGWIAGRVGRRNLMGAFLLGCGAALLGLSTASGTWGFAGWLLLLGMFSAIYHPIGSSLLVANASALGRALGWNGVWGNVGAASASGVTALIAAAFGWRAAAAAPGLVCLAVGIGFLLLVPKEAGTAVGGAGGAAAQPTLRLARPAALLTAFAVAIVAGGLTFNMTTIAAPKAIDEKMLFALPLGLVGALATAVFAFGALTQLAVGRLIDRFSLPSIFVGLALLQPLGLGLAAAFSGALFLVGLALAMSAIYGQVVVNDAMIARYVPPDWRDRAFGIRYFLGFTAAGLAAPLIALGHAAGGFQAVFSAAAAFGAAIFACALLTFALSRPKAEAAAAA